MIITNRKTTKISTVITWSEVLKTDDGVQFATMSGTIDASRPFGSTALTVHNQSLFAANEEAAREAYAAFQAEVATTASTIEPTVTTVEGGGEVADI